MKTSQDIKERLEYYVANHEVVYQEVDDLIEVSNDKEIVNRKNLMDKFVDVLGVEVYTKGHRFIKDDYTDLDGQPSTRRNQACANRVFCQSSNL